MLDTIHRRLGSPCRLAVLALWLAFSAGFGRAETPDEVAAIVAKVPSFPLMDTPAGVSSFGPSAWPLLASGGVPLAVAAESDGARIVAVQLPSALDVFTLKDDGVRAFTEGALQWLAHGKRKPSLSEIVFGASATAEELGLRVKSGYGNGDLVVVDAGWFNLSELPRLKEYLRGGGSALFVMHPMPAGRVEDPRIMEAMNRAMAPFGLAFDFRLPKKSESGRVETLPVDELSPTLHAGRAWAQLKVASAPDVAALDSIEAALMVLDDYEPSLMMPVRLRVEAGRDKPVDLALLKRLTAVKESRKLAPLDVRFGPWLLQGPFAAGNLGKTKSPLGKALAIEQELAALTAGSQGPDLKSTSKTLAGKLLWRQLEFEAPAHAADAGEMDLALLAWQGLERGQLKKAWSKRAAEVLYRTLELTRRTHLELQVRATLGFAIWVDGEEVASELSDQGYATAKVAVDLEAGLHHLVIKSVHEDGPWTLQFQAESTGGTQRPQFAASVSKAIDRGVAYLISKQRIDGSWYDYEGFGSGYTAMVLFTLAKCGVRRENPTMRRGLAFVNAHPAQQVYALSAELLLRAEIAGSSDPQLELGLAQLVDWQDTSGLYSYPSFEDANSTPVDISNTQFAALALDAARVAGLEVPDLVWHKLIRGVMSLQVRAENGVGRGFSYRPNENRITGSATVAGMSSLLFAQKALGDELTGSERKRIDKALEEGHIWISSHLIWSRDPMPYGWQYFWIYGIERVGSLLPTTTLGGVDWYRMGAEYLIGAQEDVGSWLATKSSESTLMALLFLRRATAPETGAPARAAWLSRPWETGVLAVHVTAPGLLGETLECWLTSLPDESAGAIESVEWLAVTEAGEQRLALVERKADAARFAMRTSAVPTEGFQLIGRARTADGTSFDSDPITIAPLYSLDELEFGRFVAGNLLRGAHASDDKNGNEYFVQKALDGDVRTCWLCLPGAGNSTWTARLNDSVKAQRLLFGLSGDGLRSAEANRVTRAKVVINGDREFLFEPNPSAMRPTEVRFGEVLDVKTVAVTILATEDGGEAGFSEIVLVP